MAAGESHLMRFADVSDDLIVFTYEDDLWTVPVEGGTAQRITRSSGEETFAKFSPDGTMLAFTAGYDGGNDVYIMDCKGGEPVRLTYHPAPDWVLEWFPDNEHILFRTRREFPYHGEMLYKVSIHGGTPEKLPVDRAGLASLSPDGKSVAYNRNSRELRNWKRHKGGTAQDVWVGSFALGDFKPITTFDGTDNFPMWCGDAIYFTSDRSEGTMNLFKYDLGTTEITQLTNYDDYDVKYPSKGNGYIVYQYAESLYLFELATGESSMVEVEIPTDARTLRPSFINASDYAGRFGLSPSGKRAIMDIRGEIMSIPVKEGVTYNLTQTSGIREKDPAWSPDGKNIVFLSDRTGEEELYLVCPSGTGEAKQLTHEGYGFRERPKWSPDSKQILFHDKFMRLNMADAESGEIKVIAQGEYDDGWYNWGIQDYSWSPDSRWVAYAMLEQSLYQSIFLYSLDTGETHRVTSPMTQDWSPAFSEDGYYLYFLSNRDFNPIMGFVDQNHIFLDLTRPYIVVLNEGDPAPFRSKNDAEPVIESVCAEDAEKAEPASDETAAETEGATDEKETKEKE
ncbi:MAG: DPP IV N-terminal domain-containing protein, partial [Planctomycetota bacterium]